MNLEQLKTFQEVIRLGSFSKVAKNLSISQPAVTFQVQKLEQELGIRLIDRTKKKLVLTVAGKSFLRFAESVKAEHEQLLRNLDHAREDVSGDLVIGASTIPGEFLLPPLLVKFKKIYPSVSIEVVISDSFGIIKGVYDDTYEIGFCGVLPEEQDLESFRLAGDEIVLIVSPEHPFSRRGEVLPADLEGEPYIAREETSGTNRNLEILLSRAGFDPKMLVPTLTLGTTQAVVSAVEDNAGIAFVSNLAIKRSLALGLVRQINVTGLKMGRDFFGIYRRERVVTRLQSTFIEFMKTESLRYTG